MRNLKKGFTLAEVMIVLTVIGVLTAILLPVARQSMPDENLMKFKKAHNTLGTVIRELVTSNKYYKDGDLGVMPDGSDASNPKYLCETMSDILNTKQVNCSDAETGKDHAHINLDHLYVADNRKEYDDLLITLDDSCKKIAQNVGQEIVLDNKVVFYNANPAYHFKSWYGCPDGSCVAEEHKATDPSMFYQPLPNRDADGNPTSGWKNDGIIVVYKVFCIDIDGIPENATANDCINECPFGYGIRVDGKILAGARAQQWLERDVNEE